MFCLNDYNVTGACRSQKRMLDYLDLESRLVISCMWMLGIKPRPSVKVANCSSLLNGLSSLLPYPFQFVMALQAFVAIVGTEGRTLCMLGKCSISELHLSLWLWHVL